MNQYNYNFTKVTLVHHYSGRGTRIEAHKGDQQVAPCVQRAISCSARRCEEQSPVRCVCQKQNEDHSHHTHIRLTPSLPSVRISINTQHFTIKVLQVDCARRAALSSTRIASLTHTYSDKPEHKRP